ncbi:hypothetical protein [Paenibacillus oleatilyticus]|uniref:hypothetical protein n=1 Tax=Paenibacillus oleatilyticus TaxID=2594886 RepID=UPI001C200E63|nr:hypothetical protein [Paenibacillus oleatilyticus]MBU7316119.1 hypothetical protein [Paenibacillus oleatilyticus]
MYSKKIIDLLNKDPKACMLMKQFEEAATRQGIVGNEYNEARETMLMMIMATNQEVMNLMAEDVYRSINKISQTEE